MIDLRPRPSDYIREKIWATTHTLNVGDKFITLKSADEFEIYWVYEHDPVFDFMIKFPNILEPLQITRKELERYSIPIEPDCNNEYLS